MLVSTYIILFHTIVLLARFLCSDALNTSYRIADAKDGERYHMVVMNVLNVLKQPNIW